ncbi:MAG: sulfate adenylyltransferase [Thermoplasmata archaeon]|nr:MAG: sulfate adenylyltransferase [Thermoplasmata archaeon]
MMQKPHGGKLINRCIKKKEPIDTKGLPKIEIKKESAEDIENIANGVFSPLQGFLCNNDLNSVLKEKRLQDDTPWTIPIILDVDKQEKKQIKEGETAILTNQETGIIAKIDIEDIYTFDKKNLAEAVYGTTDINHPGVFNVYQMRDILIGGKILLIKTQPTEFDKYNLTPKETRILFKEKGWREIVAFQTRNPPHLGHEYVQKTALTFVDGIFINPIIGKKKPGDFKDEVILAAYETLIKHYYLRERAVMSILRTSMKYAGPREAIHHAIMRKNFGCTHFIIGRDHAGVGNYYGPYDAHNIFSEFPDLGIVPIFFRSFFRCKKCNGIVNEKTCPHDTKYHINFSGKKIRELLRNGKIPPEDMMRKEVAETILKFEKPFVE